MGSLIPLVLLTTIVSPARAEVSFEWAEVGNPGNTPDALNEAAIPGIGSVDYPYRISKHLLTNDQYAEFLNAVAASDSGEVGQLWIEAMGSDPRGGITRSGSFGSYTYAVKPNMGDKPANLISYLSAMRFVNWLHNGQPVGGQDDNTTEDGVYAIADGVSETRAAEARFFIPTENEWYKAAYHQPSADGGDDDDYWLYSTASNDTPTVASADATGNINNPGANVANYNNGADWNGQDGNLTTVGSAGEASESYYGTSDQSGNLLEWTETVASAEESRVVRGGSWDNGAGLMQSSSQASFGVIFGDQRVGFRIAASNLDGLGFQINSGMNDAWYNPGTNGQGFLMTVFPSINQMFVAWFTFDTERPPADISAILGEPGHRWLTAQGTYSGDTADLTIYVTEGGVFDSAEPAATNDGIGDGSMTIQFADCTEGLITYEIPSANAAGEIPIQRITNDNVALCETLAGQ
jgi:formylglycine-generating enzyme required for sulfatase activity